MSFAQSGGLNGTLVTNRQFYPTDYTKALLYMADSGSSPTEPRPSICSATSGG